MSKNIYEVFVGNIGCVYSGDSESEAQKNMGEYIRQSRTNYGRAAGEDVTLFVDDDIEFSYSGSIAQRISE